MDAAQTTTAFTLDGFKIAKSLGVVRGITVRSRSMFATIGGYPGSISRGLGWLEQSFDPRNSTCR